MERAALLKYGGHTSDCRWRGGFDCDCGWSEISNRRDAASAGLNAGATALGTSSEAVARRRPDRLPDITDRLVRAFAPLSELHGDKAVMRDAFHEIEQLRAALHLVRGIIVEGATVGFNPLDGNWADRLYASQADTFEALHGKRVAVMDEDGQKTVPAKSAMREVKP